MVSRHDRSGSAALVALLVVLLFLSGVSALIYQVLWLRLLSLTFGVTTYAASVVLASFMGGLAVGSLVAGRLADRTPRPLRLFGQVELLIGLVALLTPTLLVGVHAIYAWAFSRLPDSVVLGTAVRLVMSSLVLLVPTALMGATMPIVVKSALDGLSGLGTRVSLLYAGNTAGAIIGALLAGFYLIPYVGLRRSFLLAACLNALVGVTAIAIGRASGATNEPDPQPVRGESIPRGAWVVLIVFGLSGFASLALEVVWFRVLGILLGPTSYAFTVMLATVLGGIALGSAAVTPLMRLKVDWLQVLAVFQLAAGVVALTSLSSLGRTAELPVWLHPVVTRFGLEFLAPTIASSIRAILPTAILFGAAFPVGLRLWTTADETGDRTARQVGRFYAVNTGGAILGSLAAGFVLLPIFGSRTSLILLAALFLGSGFAVQALLLKTRPVLTILSAVFLIAFISAARDVPDPQQIARRRGLLAGPTLWHEEGVQTTVVVTGSQQPGGRVLYLNGRHQASDSGAMVFVHRRIGLLPAVLAESPRRALVVGLGGGATAGALSRFPGLELDVVELSPGVVRGAAFFDYMNFDVLGRPNVHVHIDDGRDFLLRTRQMYDVITADAILPHHAGSNNLNSVEYFKLVKGRLAPRGVALHWNGGTTAAEHKTILRAFVDAFPHASLWGDGTLMVGSEEPIVLSRARIESLLAASDTREALALMNVESFDHLARMFRAGPDDIRAYLGDAPPLSDDKPTLEYFAALPQEERDLVSIQRTVERYLAP